MSVITSVIVGLAMGVMSIFYSPVEKKDPFKEQAPQVEVRKVEK